VQAWSDTHDFIRGRASVESDAEVALRRMVKEDAVLKTPCAGCGTCGQLVRLLPFTTLVGGNCTWRDRSMETPDPLQAYRPGRKLAQFTAVSFQRTMCNPDSNMDVQRKKCKRGSDAWDA
jgi:hypothetical protein